MTTTEAEHRLPRTAIPHHYDLTLEPDLEAATFDGGVDIDLSIPEDTDVIVFNAAELSITGAELVDGASGARVHGTVAVDEERERATLTLDTTARAGSWRLHLDFTGTLNDQLRGFYRSTYTVGDQQKVMATTQFEATEARRAFPCWDEPDLKATYDITLVVPEGLAAISNSPIVSDEAEGDGRRRVRFGTTMKMSTYLVAFVVGELEATEAVDVDGVPLRIVYVPGKGHLADFALEVGAFTLRFFADYYGIPYPGDKVDMIAVPDFAWGAMENLGAITYRETALLVDPASATQAELARVADVIAHELAHMWFGDLVTMKWWNGIWLNEAFATFMELLCVDAYRPDWKRWLSFADSRDSSMDIDGLATTRPIEIPVGSPEEANEMFDALTYSKGASVLRMLEQYLGAETFRRGISGYLEKHAYGNTETHDLWAALEEESGEPVSEIMDGWIFQGGHPRIDVTRSGGGFSLRQQHFRFVGGDDRRWLVPARYRHDTGDGRVLVDDATTVEAGEGFLLNAGGQGYFRTRYDDELRRELMERLPGLGPDERYVVVADSWAGVLAGDISPEDHLDVLARMGDETEAAIWGQMLGGLDELHRVATPEVRPDLEAFVVRLVRPAFERIGWEPGPDESDLERQLRGALIGALGVLGADADVRTEATAVFDRVLGGDESVDSEVAAAAIRVVASGGDIGIHERLVAAFQAATSPQQEDRYLAAIAAVPDAAAVTTTLDMVVDGRIRTQNAGSTVARLIGHRTSGPQAWAEVRDRWDEVTARFPALTARSAITFVHLRSEPDVADDVKSWLGSHPLHGAEKYTAQQLERLGIRVRLRERAAGIQIPIAEPAVTGDAADRVVTVDGGRLRRDDVVAVASRRAAAVPAPDLDRRMAPARAVVDEVMAGNHTVYGITTGFGALASTRIDPSEAEQLQLSLVRSHAAGVGPSLPAELVRAMMLLRARTLAQGHSGVRPLVVERILELLARDLLPVVPAQGSVGASGDLAPFAHLALPLVGEGMLTDGGAAEPSHVVLARHGIEPLRLLAKEGLSLLNGTEGMLSMGVLGLARADLLADAADAACAVSVDALLGSVRPFEPRIHELPPHPGQGRSAATIRRLLDGSEINSSHSDDFDHAVQDAYSLRCAPQVHGAVRDVMGYAADVFDRELLGSVVDNPIVFPEDGSVVSGGNFHGQPLAFALDFLAIAVSELASISERRTDRILDPDRSSGLPPFLAARPGLSSGYMITQYTAAALVAENRISAHPASVDSVPTSGLQEDHVSMGWGAGRKLEGVLANTARVLAIELMCAAEGVDRRAPLRPGPGVAGVVAAVRRIVPPLGEDRSPGGDIEALAQWIEAGHLTALLAEDGGSGDI